MAYRNQLQTEGPLQKSANLPGSQPLTDCRMNELVTSGPSATRIHSTQTASGDTGDNNPTCEPHKKSGTDDHDCGSDGVKSSYCFQATTMSCTTAHGQRNCAPTNSISLAGSTTNSVANSTQSENKTNLIINYLPPNMSQEEVRALFSSIGEVESCKLVREKTSGESLGYAFVKFYDPLDAGKAIKTLNGLRLQNKTVKVSLARPSSEAIKGANLYICGLPRKMTQSELENLFSSCGHIITARILYDMKTGLSRGVAFIRYDQRTEAELAIQKLNGYLPPGANEPITVKFANSPSSNRVDPSCEPNQRYLAHSDNPTTGQANPLNSIRNPTYFTNGNSATCNVPHSLQLPEDAGASCQKRSFLQGRIHNDAIRNGHPPSFACQMRRTNAPPSFGTQCCFTNVPDTGPVTSPLPPHSVNCVPSQLMPRDFAFPGHGNGANVHSNGIQQEGGSLQRTTGPTRLKCQPVGPTTTNNFGGSRSPNDLVTSPLPPNFPPALPPFGVEFMRGLGPTAHALLAPAFAASSGALTASGWCIFVYNLAPETEESTLWQLFGPFGAVQTVKVIRDPVGGKCKGFGFVNMSNYEEALLAIHSLNGFSLGNRVLQVSFKTTPFPRQQKQFNHFPFDDPFRPGMTGSLTPVPNSFGKKS